MSERPEYGEYATPEEQAAAAGTVWAPPVVGTRLEELAVEPPRRAARQGDVLATLAMLAFGVYNVFSYVSAGADLPDWLDQFFRASNIEQGFHGAAWVQAVGYVIIAVAVGGYLIALTVSVRRLRTGRLAFWVPLTAGIVVSIVVGVLVIVASGSDPAFATWLMRVSNPTPTATP